MASSDRDNMMHPYVSTTATVTLCHTIITPEQHCCSSWLQFLDHQGCDTHTHTLMYFFFQILWGRGRLVPSRLVSCSMVETRAEKALPMDSRRSRSPAGKVNSRRT